MVRTKTVARKAGRGSVPLGVPTPTSPVVLTQDVQAAEAQATAAAQRVAQLRDAQLQDSSSGGEDVQLSEDEESDAVVVSPRPNAPASKK